MPPARSMSGLNWPLTMAGELRDESMSLSRFPEARIWESPTASLRCRTAHILHMWGLEPGVAPFQRLLDCRQGCSSLGPVGSSGPLADNGCEEAGTAYKALFSSLWVQVGISPAWPLCQKTCPQTTTSLF